MPQGTQPPPSSPHTRLLTRLVKRPPRFELRRFAGPAAHCGVLSRIRVAHLTDLHLGRVTPMAIQWMAVALTNRQRPDLVVVTGDFVGHGQAYLDELEAVMASFAAPVVTVLGNHDHWAGAREVTHTLRRAGTEVLRNQCTVLTLRGQRLQVVGLDDAYTGHADVRQAVRGMDAKLPSLALSHIAEECEALWSNGLPLVLSGHTHGGQITLARLHEVTVGHIAGHRYVHGLYGDRHGANASGAVYVSAGVGSSVLPLRVGDRARREITLFELGEKPGAFPEHHAEQQPFKGRPPSRVTRERRARAPERKRKRRERWGL